ncbi:MAG: antitoxin Xre/MbcA/ParS toxin-binding domain-containing protein [Betaproteobacteria bacterium]
MATKTTSTHRATRARPAPAPISFGALPMADVVIKSGAIRAGKTKRILNFSALVNNPIGVQATIDVIRSRLPTTVVSEAMGFLSVPRNELLGALRIPVSSFHRKLSTKQALSPEETERVMRLAEITRTTSEAFGGPVEAAAWLTTANMALGGQSPLSLLDTDAGANQVRRVLAVVNYGGAL